MKKRSIFFSAVIIPLNIIIFSVLSCIETKTDQIEPLSKKDVAINISSISKKDNKLFADFIYDVGSRFNPIKKTDLDTMRSFNDIIGKEHASRVVDYKSVSVNIINGDNLSEISQFGNSNVFTPNQLKLLHASSYSTNLVIKADIEQKNKYTGELEETHWPHYFTVIPEKQAVYVDHKDELIHSNGKESLRKYLKNNSLEARIEANVEAKKLKPAKLFFTVTKSGAIKNVRLDRSSNYPLVDEVMIELIKNAPGEWQPAENKDGVKIDQELVVSFGLMGC